jgi:hypothetical protein
MTRRRWITALLFAGGFGSLVSVPFAHPATSQVSACIAGAGGGAGTISPIGINTGGLPCFIGTIAPGSGLIPVPVPVPVAAAPVLTTPALTSPVAYAPTYGYYAPYSYGYAPTYAAPDNGDDQQQQQQQAATDDASGSNSDGSVTVTQSQQQQQQGGSSMPAYGNYGMSPYGMYPYGMAGYPYSGYGAYGGYGNGGSGPQQQQQQQQDASS